jgi:hypothetical protein
MPAFPTDHSPCPPDCRICALDRTLEHHYEGCTECQEDGLCDAASAILDQQITAWDGLNPTNRVRP